MVRKTGVEGVHIVSVKRPGKPVRWYIYAWRGGPVIRKQEGGEKPTLTQADVKAIADEIEKAKPANQDTIRGLIAAYRSPKNPTWTGLADSTQELWSDCLDAILNEWGDCPLKLWNDPRTVAKVIEWRDTMAANPRKADNHVSTLSRLLEFGRLRAKVMVNVAAGIPTLYKGGNRAAVIWTDDDMAAFLKVAQPPVADAIRLASFTGLRRADLVKLTWANIGQWALEVTAAKKSAGKRRKVVMPIVPGLKELLDELRTRPRKPGVDTVLVTTHGTAWTDTGLNSSVHTTRKYAREEIGKDAKGQPVYKYHLAYTDQDGEQKWKRLHDIRGTFATKLMTIPGERLTDQEIAELMGWSVQQVSDIRRTYVDDAAIVVALGKRLARIAALTP